VLGAAAEAVVVELAYLDNTAVVGQDCSIHLTQGSMGLVAAVVVVVDAEGILDAVDTDGGVDREGEVVEWAEEEDMKTR